MFQVLLRLLLVAPLGLALSGCVAAAIPALAGTAIVGDRIVGDGKPDSDEHPERIPIDYNAPPGTPMPTASATPVAVASPSPAPARVASAELPPARKAEAPAKSKPKEAQPEPARPEPKPVKIAAVAPPPKPAIQRAPKRDPEPAPPAVAAAPIPSPRAAASRPDPYGEFVRFALNLAPPPPPGTTRRSALVDQDTITEKPELSECADSPPAVLIDLDPGTANFDPADPPSPAPGLAERLAELRSGGLTVLWTASVPVERAQEVWTVLRATGLDPDRTDRLVLPRKADDRKQTRRLAAGREWCILAIAGDRQADFDEVFDYLRDPDGPIAQALAPELGHGWFLVPTPIE